MSTTPEPTSDRPKRCGVCGMVYGHRQDCPQFPSTPNRWEREPLDAEQSEREALRKTIRRAIHERWCGDDCSGSDSRCEGALDSKSVTAIASALLEAGWSRSPRPATEAVDYVDVANRAQAETGRSIHPSTVEAIVKHLPAARPATVSEEAVKAAARAHYVASSTDWPGASAAWDDMGGSEPFEERAEAEIAMQIALIAALPHLTTQPADVGTLRIENGWLVREVNHHTCGTAEGGYYGAHEPGCGLVPELHLSVLPGWPADVDRMVREAEDRLVERIVEAIEAMPQMVSSDWPTTGLWLHRDDVLNRARSVRDGGGEQS